MSSEAAQKPGWRYNHLLQGHGNRENWYQTLDSEHFSIMLDRAWKQVILDEQNCYSAEHSKFEMGLNISWMLFDDMPEKHFEPMAVEVANSRIASQSEYDKMVGENSILSENSIEKTSWGVQIIQYYNNGSKGGQLYSGFICRKFLLQVTVESNNEPLNVVHQEYGRVLAGLDFAPDVWADPDSMPELPLH